MHMRQEDHDRAAQALQHAAEAGHQIGAISQDHPGMTLEDSYAIQSLILDRAKAAGRHVAGYKVAFSSPPVMRMMGMEEPARGVLLGDMAFPAGGTVPCGAIPGAAVEAEILFRMGDDLHGADCTPQDVLAATEYVAPALELIGGRVFAQDPVTGAARRAVDLVADNTGAAGFVIGGARHKPGDVALDRVGVSLARDGLVEETGLGASVHGHPLDAMAWLARNLAKSGEYLRRGDVVLAGSLVRPVPVGTSRAFAADFGHFGHVTISFEQES